jgi:hypothetical protein
VLTGTRHASISLWTVISWVGCVSLKQIYQFHRVAVTNSLALRASPLGDSYWLVMNSVATPIRLERCTSQSMT